MKCAKNKCRGKIDFDIRLGVWVEGMLIATHPCGTCKILHSESGSLFFSKHGKAGFFKEGMVVFKTVTKVSGLRKTGGAR
jgi:hypothetical protein